MNRSAASITLVLGLILGGFVGTQIDNIIGPNGETTNEIFILEIPNQQTITGIIFSLDLSPYIQVISDNHAINVEVYIGGGAFGELVYQNIFSKLGVHYITFRVNINLGNWFYGTFLVDVLPNYDQNEAPVISEIDDDQALEGVPYFRDLSSFVSDDFDGVEDLIFEVDSEHGMFTYSIFINSFNASGLYQVNFTVTDTLGAFSQANFTIEALDNYLEINDTGTVYITEIPDQTSVVGVPFSLDLSLFYYISNANITAIEVLMGGGIINRTSYENTFLVSGNVSVAFRLQINWGNWTYGVFQVEVFPDFAGNEPPVIGLIPQKVVIAGSPCYFNLDPYVSDDSDTNLLYIVDSGSGSFSGSIYYHTFNSANVYDIFFTVSDSLGESTQGNFTVIVNPNFYDNLPENAVYVSPYGTDSDSGLKGQPFKTLNRAIDEAVVLGASQILIGQGIYNETITMVDGISLLGGYSYNFEWYNLDFLQSMIVQLPSVSDITLIAEEILLPTVIQGLEIHGPNTRVSGQSSYAIYLKDSNVNLVIRDCVIIGGNSGDGAYGSSGEDGQKGIDGFDGLPPAEYYTSNENTGGLGGSSPFARGGDGGTAGAPVYNNAQSNGDSGLSGPVAGLGGLGGYASSTLKPSSVIIPSDNKARSGSNGEDGLDGSNGGGGSGGSGGTVVGEYWQTSDGDPGSDGSYGGGGGGGGASGGIEDTDDINSSVNGWLGGSGGGGGAGGGYGSRGSSGIGGGGSFSIFIYFSSAPSSIPQIYDNIIYLGLGGNGGHGGNGGTGGQGGTGGIGGSGDGLGWPLSAAGNGGIGGTGGNGGHGGGAGGGAGGPSYGIFVEGYGGTPYYNLNNSIFITTGGGGAGGLGGYSFGNEGQQGTDGELEEVNY
jgi:hypothetical protein